MITPTPDKPKIYHIVHVDQLRSIIDDNRLWCDAEISKRPPSGTIIGMSKIKQRRLKELTLESHPNLHVGDCVPFYFCPRSIMLYLIHKANARELSYRGGQAPIIHLEADLRQTVDWAENNNQCWVFTLSNAGARLFQDRCDLSQLTEINWTAVQATDWRGELQDGKQAEFLIEREFSWHLVSRIGVFSSKIHNQVSAALKSATHQPPIEIITNWYY